MYKKLIFVIIFGFLSFFTFSQSIMEREIDYQTYQHYLKNDWNNLMKTGKKAKRNNVDFYYLQYRLGIAYYNKKRYRIAIKHFSKVLDKTPTDETALEYQYYSYLLGGQADDAIKLSKKFDSKLKKKIGINDNLLVSSVDVSMNVSNSLSQEIIDNYNYTPLLSNTGYQSILQNYYNYHLGLLHQLTPSFSVYHAYTHLNKTDFIALNDGTALETFNSTIKLNQYYLALKYTFKYNWALSAGIHFLNNRIPYEKTTGWGARQQTIIQYTNENDLVGFVSLEKSISLFNLNISGSISNLNNQTQIQKNVGITLFPLANLNMYATYTISHNTLIESSVKTNNLVHQGTIGFKITKFLWLETLYAQGIMQNFTTSNSFIVNNSLNPTNKIFNGKLIIPISKKPLKLWLGYSIWNSESSYLSENSNQKYNKLQLTNQSITGGFIWNF